jgi:protein-S-isoprenylcysteine O-methyltransferase Ste14
VPVDLSSVAVQLSSPRVNSRFDQLRNNRAYDLGMRAIGSGWFLLLGVAGIYAGMQSPDAGGLHAGDWSKVLARAGIVLFYLTLWLLILIRPSPVGRSTGVLPSAMAFAGSYMPWLIPLLPRQELSGAGYLTATTLILCGNVLTLVVVWHLGRSFSIVPQARKLVTTGPYAMIRHPLYLAEETMVIGTALMYVSPMTIALVAVHFFVQTRRMVYEEAVLGQAFPSYSAYAQRTRRVLPGVW